MSDQVWPEFRRWYELTMEEQRIYNEEDTANHDELLDAVDRERGPLERAMQGRRPETLQHLAMLAVIELRHAEKFKDPFGDGCKLLTFGMMTHGNGYPDQGAILIESTIKLALANNILPGITIYGEGGNA